jgi:hypothetical protein
MTVWVILKEYYTGWDEKQGEHLMNTEIYKVFDSHEKASNEWNRLMEFNRKYGNYSGNHYYVDKQEVY